MNRTEVDLREKIQQVIDFLSYYEVEYQYPVQFEEETTHQYLERVLDDINVICSEILKARKDKRADAYEWLQWAINDDTDEAQYRKNYR